MTEEANEALVDAGVEPGDIRAVIGADLRYSGQQNEVGIVFHHDPRADRDIEMIRTTFEAAYFAQYGVNPSHVPIEAVSWRLTSRGPENTFEGAAAPTGTPGTAKSERTIPLWKGAPAAKVYDRATLAQGQTITGPALIEERETTIVLPPGWVGTIDPIGCIIAKRSA